MTLTSFDSPEPVSTAAIVLAALCAAAWIIGAAALLFRALNGRAGWSSLFSREGGWLWTVLGAAAVLAMVRSAAAPLFPAGSMGLWNWPAPFVPETAAVRVLYTGILGAFAFLIASETGLAGRLDRWAPYRPKSPWGLAARGLMLGLAAGFFGVYCLRSLHICGALHRLGFTSAGDLLLVGAPLLFVASTAGAAVIVLSEDSKSVRARILTAVCLALLWGPPVELAEAHLTLNWDWGKRSLAEAARVPPEAEARSVAVVILSKEDGSPGRRGREYLLAGEGVDLSRASLSKLRLYLEARDFRTIFRREALAALRRGWLLNWETEEHMRFAMVRRGPRLPADYAGFLGSITVAPATVENYARLERMARVAWTARIPRVKAAQDMFEGFSTAYARFGDLENSNMWLERIQGLWPLYDDDIHIEPVVENHEGKISGKLLFNGNPAVGLRIGLFSLPASTMAVASGKEGLADAMFPSDDGSFVFENLLPGRYYLGLQADPAILSDPRLEFRNAPGVVKLALGRMSEELFPIEIVRPARGAPAPPSEEELRKKDLKTLLKYDGHKAKPGQ